MAMRAQYIRFRETVMSPGRANQNIGKAYTHDGTGMLEERMEEILIERDWVVLRAIRKDTKGKPYLATRRTHVSNVRDFEEETDTEEPKTGGQEQQR